MFEKSEYEAAEYFKGLVARSLDKRNWGEEFSSVINTIALGFADARNKDPRHSISWYAMAISTLSSFWVNEDYGQYWLPTTRKCCERYRKIRSQISKGKPVYMTIGYGDLEDQGEFQIRIA